MKALLIASMVSLNVRNLQINKKMLLTAPTEAYTVMKKKIKEGWQAMAVEGEI